MTETIIAWDRLYRRGVRTVNLVAVRFMFICVDSTAFVNYVNMAFAIKISRLMITSDNVPSANIGPTLFIDNNLLLGERNSNKL